MKRQVEFLGQAEIVIAFDESFLAGILQVGLSIAHSPLVGGEEAQPLSKLETGTVEVIPFHNGLRGAISSEQRHLRTEFLIDAGAISDVVSGRLVIAGAIPESVVSFAHA